MLKFLKKISLFLALFLLLANNVFALGNINDLKSTNFGLNTTATKVGFDPAKTPKVAEIAGNIIGVALSLLGVIFMILVIYGGFIWMMAKGNEQEADKAKDILVNATIGVAVVFSAYVVTNFILESLSQTIAQ